MLALSARLLLWRRYLDGLRADRAPAASVQAFDAIAPRLVRGGHLLPGGLALLAAAASLAGLPGAGIALAAAGLLAVAAGGWFKYTLITRAAFTQGFSIPHRPVRGVRAPGR